MQLHRSRAATLAQYAIVSDRDFRAHERGFTATIEEVGQTIRLRIERGFAMPDLVGKGQSEDSDELERVDCVVYSKVGYTKSQVISYYDRVMPWLLPEIIGRPMSLLRCPDGVRANVDSTCFFQKHFIPQFGDQISALPMNDSRGKRVEFMYVSGEAGARDLVQMNTLEFHPWGAKVPAVERADRLTLDLDPGYGVEWKKVIAAAELIHHMLADIGLQSFVKLSGGKGLHVVIPLKPAQPWEMAKQFCRGIAGTLTKLRPKEFIEVATKSRRSGRIFVDYMRNLRGATSIAAYSLRARDAAAIAMPVSWDEVHRIESASAFNLSNVAEHLAQRQSDPWQAIDDIKQNIRV